jgi:ketosteroid isomerase-like protein
MTENVNEQTRVRAHLEKWLDASRAMDIDAIMACYVPGAVSYDCHSAFQFRDLASHRKHLEACFPHMVGPVTLEMHELAITTGDDVAFCHATMRCGCQSAGGTEHWSWLRSTICMKKVGGQWLIAHDHCSAPFDPMTNQAMLDAGPAGLKKVA